MMDTILTVWAIAGAIVWLLMHHAGTFDRFTERSRHPAGVLSILTIGVVVGWPIWVGYYVNGLPRRYRAGKLWGRGR